MSEFTEEENVACVEFEGEDYLFEIGGVEAYETRRVDETADDGYDGTAASSESKDGLLWPKASGAVLIRSGLINSRATLSAWHDEKN